MEAKQRQKKTVHEREERIAAWKAKIEEIRAGRAYGMLVRLAQSFYGLLPGEDHKGNPAERLVKAAGDDVAAAAMEGFASGLRLHEWPGPEEVGRVMRAHADYISQETLSERLVDGAPETDAKSETQKVEGMQVTLGVRKV